MRRGTTIGGGPHGRIGEIGDGIKYRIAFKSIAVLYLAASLLRPGGACTVLAGECCGVPPTCCIQELFASYRRAAGLGRLARHGCGCSSGVEHNLAKVGVEGSNPFARSNFSQLFLVVKSCPSGPFLLTRTCRQDSPATP